jgi:hypothetical protein
MAWNDVLQTHVTHDVTAQHVNVVLLANQHLLTLREHGHLPA